MVQTPLPPRDEENAHLNMVRAFSASVNAALNRPAVNVELIKNLFDFHFRRERLRSVQLFKIKPQSMENWVKGEAILKDLEQTCHNVINAAMARGKASQIRQKLFEIIGILDLGDDFRQRGLPEAVYKSRTHWAKIYKQPVQRMGISNPIETLERAAMPAPSRPKPDKTGQFSIDFNGGIK